MTAVARRLCEGCELPLPTDAHPNRRYHDDDCARAAHRRADDLFGRQATFTFPGPRSGANARSGLQISFTRAVAALEQALREEHTLGQVTEDSIPVVARQYMTRALPERQRARLEARDAA